jgi:hypothetical protein
MQPEHAAIEDRVRMLERDTRAHARSLTEIVKVGHDHDTEIKRLGTVTDAHEKELEKFAAWQTTRLIAEAREEERDKSLKDRLDRIDTSIKAVKDDIVAGRGIWIKLALVASGPVIAAAVYVIATTIVHGLPSAS